MGKNTTQSFRMRFSEKSEMEKHAKGDGFTDIRESDIPDTLVCHHKDGRVRTYNGEGYIEHTPQSYTSRSFHSPEEVPTTCRFLIKNSRGSLYYREGEA